jgi:hypothetical protein
VVVTTRRGQVWMSIQPPFTWEAIMEPVLVDELIRTLALAAEDAKKMVSGTRGSREGSCPRLPGNALDCLPRSRGPAHSLCSAVCPVPLLTAQPKGRVSPLPVAPVPYPESHPFAWFPLTGQRHAIDRRDRNIPVGSPMRCLCGVTHLRGADGDMEWLWPTCERCWDEACRIVGVRRRG